MNVSEKDITTRLAQGEELVSTIGQAVMGYPKTIVLTTQRIMVFQNSLTKTVFNDYYFRDMADVKFSTNLGGGLLVLKVDRGNNAGRIESIEKLPLDESKSFYQQLVGIERDWFEKKRSMQLEDARARSGAAQVVVGTGAATAPALDIEGKLISLKSLFDKGIITEQEYAS